MLLDKIGSVSHGLGVQLLPHDVSFLQIVVSNGFQTLDISIFTVALFRIAGGAFTGIGGRLFILDLYRFIQLEGVGGRQWEEA